MLRRPRTDRPGTRPACGCRAPRSRMQVPRRALADRSGIACDRNRSAGLLLARRLRCLSRSDASWVCSFSSCFERIFLVPHEPAKEGEQTVSRSGDRVKSISSSYPEVGGWLPTRSPLDMLWTVDESGRCFLDPDSTRMARVSLRFRATFRFGNELLALPAVNRDDTKQVARPAEKFSPAACASSQGFGAPCYTFLQLGPRTWCGRVEPRACLRSAIYGGTGMARR